MFLEVASQLVGLGSWADWSSRMGRLFYLVAWVVPCIQLNVIQHGQKKKKKRSNCNFSEIPSLVYVCDGT